MDHQKAEINSVPQSPTQAKEQQQVEMAPKKTDPISEVGSVTTTTIQQAIQSTEQKLPPTLITEYNLSMVNEISQAKKVNQKFGSKISLRRKNEEQKPIMDIQEKLVDLPKILFNDDDPLMQIVKKQQNEANLKIQIKAQRSLLKLKTPDQLPAMVSIKSHGGNRMNVDLMCVIDVSGSMQGQKIQLVNSTLKYLIEALTPYDRLSLITFSSSGQRLCPLKSVTGENMGLFQKVINNINAGGSTNINSGLELALKTMRDRKHVNNATSIFLLSDGQDKEAESSFKAALGQPINQNLGDFTLQSFGFGLDHDENLMSQLCQIKGGSFYFIKQLQTLDEAFCNALGGVLSLVATNITIKLENTSKNLTQGIIVKKVYGKMWQKVSQKEYSIKILNIISGVSKDFIFELSIPGIDAEVGDIERQHNILKAYFTAHGSQQLFEGQCSLDITFLNQSQNIADAVENIEVIQNYLRVKAVEAIEQNLKKADQHRYEEAQKGIQVMIKAIEQNKKAKTQKMKCLVEDLRQVKQKCSLKDYGVGGRKIMLSMKTSHQMQETLQYSNYVQEKMSLKLKERKTQS